jgi:hypothetical protein
VTWLQRIVVAYVALFAVFCVVWLVALEVLRWRDGRRFRRDLVELQREADAVLAQATLARLAGEP